MVLVMSSTSGAVVLRDELGVVLDKQLHGLARRARLQAISTWGLGGGQVWRLPGQGLFADGGPANPRVRATTTRSR